MNKPILTKKQEMIWISLTSLEDNQRMTGSDLQQHTGVKERDLFKDIREMRRKGFLIAAAKDGNRGYYEARSLTEALETIKGMQSTAIDQLETASFMRRAALEKFGETKEDKEPE
jgi:predicted DNA-binding transcriptional regulator YafY